ncbi:restriction endonuclease subunit S [Campylobacter iguaniorum]|uniref:restriction endonuclease subunit S n=1 Tax=Campylobacter iguaniorum TaxID=1244531 RepID=UPI0009EEE191|nr:restriction endonuclease subunit S [Campylobacter iguaniorum]
MPLRRHKTRERELSDTPLKWQEFKIGELFNVNSSKQIFHANQIKEIYDIKQENTYPYVVRSTLNNGIRGYIKENKDFLNPANTLSFAQDTFSVFYQEKPYFTGNKVKILTPKFQGFNKKLALFIVSIYQKALAHLTWGVGSTTESIQDIKIEFPINKDGTIAFEFMENYIKAIEKEVIKSVVLWSEKRLNATKQVISKPL